jgi:hypothetical protein
MVSQQRVTKSAANRRKIRELGTGSHLSGWFVWGKIKSDEVRNEVSSGM